MDAGRKYTLILHTNSITDLEGNGLAEAYTIRFTTTAAPVVSYTIPINNSAFNIPINQVVQIHFKPSKSLEDPKIAYKPIKFGTNPWIEYKNSSGTTKPFTPTISGNILYLTPNTHLSEGTKYTVILHSNSITDLTGTAGMPKTFTLNFTTKS